MSCPRRRRAPRLDESFVQGVSTRPAYVSSHCPSADTVVRGLDLGTSPAVVLNCTSFWRCSRHGHWLSQSMGWVGFIIIIIIIIVRLDLEGTLLFPRATSMPKARSCKTLQLMSPVSLARQTRASWVAENQKNSLNSLSGRHNMSSR